jgi:parvulin-like peptidyl-prolyl isomerase
VNDEIITLEAFEQEIARYEAAQLALGIDLATLGDYRDLVLQGMIDRRLLAQEARTQGFVVEEADLQARIDALTAEIGQENFEGWLTDNGYTESAYREALQEDLLVTQMIEFLTAEVPSSETQVHARHILVGSLEEADLLRRRIVAGADFADLALAYSVDLSTRLAGGDLGWFSRGTLTVPELEEAAFALQPGELSEVIETMLGYHVLELLDKAERPLAWDALQVRRRQAVETWLAAQREAAEIEIFIAAQP